MSIVSAKNPGEDFKAETIRENMAEATSHQAAKAATMVRMVGVVDVEGLHADRIAKNAMLINKETIIMIRLVGFVELTHKSSHS